MKAEQHRAKAERIERSLAKFTDDDVEMKIEAAMLAATHWVNFALHMRSITVVAEDVVHNSMLTVSMLRKYSLAEPELMETLTAIEDLRPCFVRGDVSGEFEAAARALTWLRSIGVLARRAAGEEGV
ncbi:hypothetical protein [Paraburkholderia sediminicola]|uniref:hypothetical protein n=1 Tax=Paraburkholderia sediminicola TaxID=458836 RepID=UPI000E751A4C